MEPTLTGDHTALRYGYCCFADGAAVDRLKELQDVYFMREIDHQTLEQLEKNVWPAPEFGSYLVTTCHQLRKKRLCDFTVEDLRIMIGQDIGIKFLIPKAIKVLKENPFAEGDFFEGDLLVQVVRVKQSFLKENPSLYQDLIHICDTALASLDPVFSNRDHAHIERFLDQS